MTSRTILNIFIDAFAFIAFVLMTATGFVLRISLPPGSGGLHGAGMGSQSGERAVTLLWGMTRHQWGDVHFYIAVGLMCILTIHLILHWRWIVCVVKGRKPEGSGTRVALGVLGLIALMFLAFAPFLSETYTVPRSQLNGKSDDMRRMVAPYVRENIERKKHGSD